MENSGQKVKRHKILRWETLRRAKTSKCIGGCKGNLLKLANNNLNRNNSTFFRCNHCSTCRNNKLGQNLSSKKFMSKFRNTFEPINKRVCTSRRWKNRYKMFWRISMDFRWWSFISEMILLFVYFWDLTWIRKHKMHKKEKSNDLFSAAFIQI